MSYPFCLFKELKESALKWRADGYPCADYPAIGEILAYQTEMQEGLSDLRFLREPQFLALQVYWYIRLVLGTPHIIDIYKHYYGDDKKSFFSALDIPISRDALDWASIDDILEKIKNDEEYVKEKKIQAVHEALRLEYPSYILALAMGAGKTALIGAIIATEFAMSLRYPDGGFMKNAMVFAPGTTIVESLRELSDMPYNLILPPDLLGPFLTNLKIEFLGREKEIQTLKGSSYNLIVTNTEKISLRAKRGARMKRVLAFNQKVLEANLRLQTIAGLPALGIFSDEAHHTYGNPFDKIKRVRETIDYIHAQNPLIAVINTTGTPYHKKQTLKEVIVWYGLGDGIRDNILKSVHNGIHQYDMNAQSDEEVFEDILRTFFETYGEVTLANGAKAKIAFYFKTQAHLDDSCAIIERVMAKIGENVTQILVNTQASSSEDINEFNRLNNPGTQKRIILLIAKGVEGWNCPSLFACALIKEQQTSSNYVLQAATRCLRQTAMNMQSAKIFLDMKNGAILNKEFKNNFDMTLGTVSGSWCEKKTVTLQIRKTDLPKLEIIRTIRKIVHKKAYKKPLTLRRPVAEDAPATLRSILTPDFSGGRAALMLTGEIKNLPVTEKFTDYQAVAHKLARKYHLSFMPLAEQLKTLYPRGQVPDNHLYGLFRQVEIWQANYETVEENVREVMALIRVHDETGKLLFQKDENGFYTHRLRLLEDTYRRMKKHGLFAGKEEYRDDGDLSFHYTPYNFDSVPEREAFKQILHILGINPGEVAAFLFVGGLTDVKKTDFHFEYRGEDGRYHRYFPDFVLVKKTGEFYIIEIKSESERGDKVVEAKAKAIEQLRDLQPEKFRYSVIYTANEEVGADKLKSVSDWIGGVK